MTAQVMTVFRNRLREEHLDEYHEWAARMDSLARSMPGFVDASTYVGADGERVTIVVFADPESQRAWRDHPDHRAAQSLGVARFYATYSLLVGTVTHQSEFDAGR